MIRQWRRLFYDGRMSVSDKALHRKDFVLAAQADGFEFACRVEREDELEERLKAFVAFDGPAFLEVMIDENADVFPMVGPGQTYETMITGPFIPSRSDPDARSGSMAAGAPSDMF